MIKKGSPALLLFLCTSSEWCQIVRLEAARLHCSFSAQVCKVSECNKVCAPVPRLGGRERDMLIAKGLVRQRTLMPKC
ncbi:hypothetical protein FRX31_012144 [Thalictrum thalictroides]|uniref:Secreted protein n=1 Tax=Thalictrum thalictroides TaxID=46969 RepID=A0A7J6WNU6_THATH|nr:hypothetical protein FRX31_012144 [Thalictrum thalictroides]